MARPKKSRLVKNEPGYDSFLPGGIPIEEKVFLTVDEYEVIRLIDLENKKQDECAAIMKIARTTVTSIYECARYKIADAIVNGKRMYIRGGNYILSKQENNVKQKNLKEKGEKVMRIAVTYDNGNIFGHFGRCEKFKAYDIEDGKVVSEHIIDADGNGHGALAGLLKENGVDVLICGGIGEGAKNMLGDSGLKLYGGVSGTCDQAVKDFLDGNLSYVKDITCNHHHDHDHDCHSHGHSCGHGKCEK